LIIVGGSLQQLKSTVEAHKNNPNKIFEIEHLEEEVINNMDEIPHKILLLSEDEKNEYRNNAFAPCRIMVYDKSIALDDMIIDDDYYLCLYEKFVDEKIFNKKLSQYKLVCAINEYEFPSTDENSYTNNCLKIQDHEIVFFNHPEASQDKFFPALATCAYVQPISGSYSTKVKLTTWISLPKNQLSNFFLELFEAAFTKIVIVDERVSQWADKTFLNNHSIRDILKKMSIFVPKIDLNNCSYEKLQAELQRESEYNVLNGSCDVHFFIIHQGVLDKLEEGEANKLLGGVTCKWKVVDSGRGVPKEFEEAAYKEVRFIEISTLLKMLENFDKHGIVQTLFALRRPRGNQQKMEVQNA